MRIVLFVHSLPGLRERERHALGQRARKRVLAEHTAAHHARELEGYAISLLGRRAA